MKVLCIDDSKLPLGAEIKEGSMYKVTEQFVNGFDQKTYYLQGVVNKGRTKFGLPWNGYKAERFIVIDNESAELTEKKTSHLILN
jgi:hypothetical protein